MLSLRLECKISITDFQLYYIFLSPQISQNRFELSYPVLTPWIRLTSLWPKLFWWKFPIISSLLILCNIVLVSFFVRELRANMKILGRWPLSEPGTSQWKFWLYKAVKMRAIICRCWNNCRENILGMRILCCFHILCKHHSKGKSSRKSQYTTIEICTEQCLLIHIYLNTEYLNTGKVFLWIILFLSAQA